MNNITTQRKGYDMAGPSAKPAAGKGLTRKQVAAPPPPPPEVDDDQQYEEEQPPEVQEAAEEEYADTPPEGDTQEGDGEEPPPEEEAPPAPVQAAPKSNQAKTEDYMAEQERLLMIDETNIKGEFINQAARYFKAAKNYYKAEAVLRQQKDILTDITSKKDAEIRSSGEKVTEAYIDKAIKGDVQVQAQMAVINKATLQVGLHMANMHAWGHKKDMLVQVGVLERAEMSQGPQVNRNSNQQPLVNGRRTTI